MNEVNGNISVNAIEQQIANAKKNTNANTGRNKFNEKDYLDTKLKEGQSEKELRIRLLPATQESGMLAVEVKTHPLKVSTKIAKSGFKAFICLNDEQIPNHDDNVKCPICEKAFELFKEAKKLKSEGNKEAADTIYKKASSLMPKVTYITRVIDRSKENEGVKFWRFNKTTNGDGIFDKLIKLYNNRNKRALERDGKGYNIFDVNEGRDLIITITRTFSQDGKELANKIAIDVDEEKTPLSNDPEQMKVWIEDTKKWYEAYTTRTAPYLKLIADDKVPYRLPDGTYVDAAEVEQEHKQEEDDKKAAKKEAEKVLNNCDVQQTEQNKPTANENTPSGSDVQEKVQINTTTSVNTQQSYDDEEDLPF